MATVGRGAYGILLTTYDSRDTVYLEDLVTQASFVASTAQGIVWPVLASEFFLMTASEIQAGYPAVAEGNSGRVPFVAGVSAATTQEAARMAEAAALAGADAVIAMAPFIKKASGTQLLRHFEAIAAAGLPIVVQNAEWLGGAGALNAAELRMLREAVPAVQHLKEEAPVLPQTISKALAALPGVFTHIFGGGGGRFLIDELQRGGSGTMTACEWIDLLGAIVESYDQGDSAAARRLHGMALSGITLETAYGMAGAREVLRRRGVIRYTASRYSPDTALDGDALIEIQAILAFLEPVLRGPHTGRVSA